VLGIGGLGTQLGEQRAPRMPMVRPTVDQHPIHIEDRGASHRQ
jgi:hypothetical protein